MSKSVADILAESLDAIERGEMTPAECLARYPQHRAELEASLRTVQLLRGAPLPAPSPEFRQGARARLLNRLPPRRPRRLVLPFLEGWGWRPAAVRVPVTLALVVALLVLGGGGVAYAWHHALPGDHLYTLKIAVEDARLAAADDEDQVKIRLRSVESRVREIEALADQERYEDVPIAVNQLEGRVAELTRFLSTMGTEHAVRIGDLTAADRLLSETGRTLADLLPGLASESRFWVESAVEVTEDYRAMLATAFPTYVKASFAPLPELSPTP
jgi:hypothetical protein